MVDLRKEVDIQRDILFWLKESGYKAWRNHLGARFIAGGIHAKNPQAGQPDIYGIFKTHPGQLFCIEIKSSIGKLSDEQRREIGELERAGVYVIAARDLETVKQLLGEKENVRN